MPPTSPIFEKWQNNMDYAFEITMILQFLLIGWVIFLLKTKQISQPTPKQRQFGYVFSGFLALICAYLA